MSSIVACQVCKEIRDPCQGATLSRPRSGISHEKHLIFGGRGMIFLPIFIIHRIHLPMQWKEGLCLVITLKRPEFALRKQFVLILTASYFWRACNYKTINFNKTGRFHYEKARLIVLLFSYSFPWPSQQFESLISRTGVMGR